MKSRRRHASARKRQQLAVCASVCAARCCPRSFTKSWPVAAGLIGCTKQNGDAARKGCIAVLLVWFDLPVLVLALLRLAAQLLRPPWLEFCGWIFGFLAHARLSEPS